MARITAIHRTPPPRAQPARCSCMHATDTAEWHGKRRSGAGLTGKGGANHLDPKCPHSELHRTVTPAKKKQTVQKLRIT